MAFDYDENGSPIAAAGGFDYDEAGNPIVAGGTSAARTFAGTAKDVGISALKSAISVPEIAVGLADIPTGGAIGNLVEGAGVKFKDAKRLLDEELSPAQQAANRRVEQADGFFPTIGALLENPSVIAHGAIESLGSMGAGGVIGRGVVGVAPKVSPWIAAAIGEGAATSGLLAESTRQTTGNLTAAQSGMAVAAGLGTGALGAIGGRLAKRLGVDDIDTMLVKGIAADASEDAAVATVKKGIARRILEGGLTEGIFEELPQSAQEQVWQNAALGRPLMDGVDKAAAQGMLIGAAMGGGGNLIGSIVRPAPTVEDISKAPTPDDAIAAADAALSAPIDTLSSTIDAFKSEWAADASRVPADSALPMVGVPAATDGAPAIALTTDGAPVEQPIVTPDRPIGPALIALAEQLSTLPAGEQTKALMRLDSDMRQRVVQTMRAMDTAVPSGLVVPAATTSPGMGEAARITNEATVAASSVQPVADIAVTNVPALTQRAAQEIVSKSSGMEMRPHREVPGRFEVVPIAGPQTTQASLVPPTLPLPTTQQALAEQEGSMVPAAPAAPAARPVVPAAPLTAEQLAVNQAAADAERSSLPRRTVFQNSQLRSETGPDIKGEKVTRNMRKVLAQMGRITGTKVVFEYAPGSSDGAVPIRGIESNTIHINTASPVNPMQVMGHEVTHVLRGRHAAAWSKVRDALVATMPDKRKGLDDFAANYWGVGERNKEKLTYVRAIKDWSRELTDDEYTTLEASRNTIEDFLLDEMVSDLGGKHWTDEKFWLDVFAKIEKAEGAKAKGIIERMVIAIRETLTKFLAVVRAQKQGDYATISPEQIEATRDAITSAYAQFIRAERRTEPDGEPHVTDHRISTSDTHSRTTGSEPQPAAETPAPVATGDEDELESARAAELAQLSPARQRLFFEAAPNPDDKSATQQWREAGRFGRGRIDAQVRKVIVPGLLRDLHIAGEIVPQLGGWMDATNPSFALIISRGDPALAARAIGYVLDQQAMYMLGLERFTGAEKTGIIHFDIAGKDAHKIYMQVRALDSDVISGHSTVGNEMYIGVPFDRMQALRQSVVEIARTNNLTVSFDEGYGATLKEYGYGIQGERQVARGLRATARDVNRWRAEADALRSDAAGRRSDRAGVARKSEQRPSYGEGSGETVVGVHYSRQQRDTLSSAFFGTGMKAQERFRIASATDPRIKKRLYFYANTGKGIAPESDVGHHAHSVTLNNVYDMDVDPKTLYKRLAEGDPYQSPDQLMNDFESRVIDAGFNGYMTREFGKGGAVVLLGAHSVPVQYEGERARPDVPEMPAPRFSDEQQMRRKLAENRKLPAGKMTGLEWKRTLMREMPELDPRWLDNNTLYRKDELIPRSEPARMSESRPPSWWYSPLARAAETATMKKAPASGWKSWLKSLAAKGVKPDEIKWSGIEEWLDVQGEATVTREQVQAYLSEFGVRIETILRGESNPVRPVTDTTQEVEGEEEDLEVNVSFGNFETDDPDDYYLRERAEEQLSERMDERVEAEADDIESDLRAAVVDEIDPSEYRDEVLQDMGSLFDPSDEEVRAEAKRRAVIAWVNDMWQGFADDTDITLEDDEDAIETAMNRAFDVAMGDLSATRDEAERRARAEIDEGQVLKELIEQERSWYYDDSYSPATRTITVTVGDDEYEFIHNNSYGEHYVSYNGREVRLSRNSYRTDDADIQGDILTFLQEEEGVSFTGSAAADSSSGYRSTKWDGYATDKNRAVPGSYREVQLTLPPGAFGMPKSRKVAGNTDHTDTARVSTQDFYYTTHWQEANVIGHARFDEHIDGDGKRVLVLQEVQGDWGQQRREGLEAAERAASLLATLDERRAEKNAVRVKIVELLPDTIGWSGGDWRSVERLGAQGLDGSVSSDVMVAADKLHALDTEVRDLQREYDALNRDLPDAAPFIEKTPQWAGLVLKRMIVHAIEYGFDKVVWTTGAQQVERWRNALRKQVDTIKWEKTEDGIHITASQNGRVRTDTKLAENALSDAIGKVMAKQIIADPNQSGEITGDDITISDTGMAGFYDRMLPNIANDILRKFDKDVRVKDVEVHETPLFEVSDLSKSGGSGFAVTDAKGRFATGKTYSTLDDAESSADALRADPTLITTQQGFEVTDKLRESVANGVPLFSQRRASTEARLATARKEWYRSQLSDAVGNLPAKIRTGREAALWLQSNAAKLQVKKDELQWSGILDWLQTQRSVTGAQIQDWLANNGVRVKTVVLGIESDEYRRLDGELQAMDGEIDRLRTAAWDSVQGDQKVVARMSGMMPLQDIKDAAAGNGAASRQLQSLGYNHEQLEAMLAYGKALNRKNELFELRKAARGEQVKWNRADLNIAGGAEYRELLLTLPSMGRKGMTMAELKHADFRGGHYQQPNVLAHIRFDERTDADDKRVLFIQEAQSDWGQTGRKEGFNTPIAMPDGTTRTPTTGVPAAPFVTDTKSWVALALKRMISHAVDNGFDRVAWTTGEQQQNRYWEHELTAPAIARWKEISKPKSGGEQLLQYFGRELAAVTPLKIVDTAMFGTTKHNEIEKAVVEAIPVNVVNILANNDITSEQLVRNPYVVGNRLPVDARPAVARGLAGALELVGTRLRAALLRVLSSDSGRRDEKLFGAIRASDLSGGEVMRLLSTRSPDGTGGGKSSSVLASSSLGTTGPRAESTVSADALTRESPKFSAAELAVFLNRHAELLSERTGNAITEYVVQPPPGEGMVAFYDGIVTQVARQLGATVSTSNKLLAQTGSVQPGFDITDKMREQARIGMPLFSQRRAAPADNLQRWLGKSKVRTVMYHGTARDITTFRPQQADAIFLTDDPEFAANFADMSHSWMLNNFWTWMSPEQIQAAKRDAMRMLLQDALPGSSLYMREERLLNQSQQPSQYMRRAVELYMPSESNIMPLYVRAENPFDYRNPEHVAAIEREIGTSWMGYENIHGAVAEVAQHIGDLERGDWNAIESQPVQDYIRANHDSFYVRERGVTNLAVFSPNQVKSASGNTGAYSRDDNDIRASTPRSRITGQPINQSWTDPIVTDWDDFVRKIQDNQVDTKRVLRAIRDAGVAIAERFDPYLMETDYHGRAASRVKNFTDGELRKLLEDMHHRSLSMEDLDDYLWARHAAERNAANAKTNPAITDGSGLSDAQAADILAGRSVTVQGRTIQLSAQSLRAAAAVAARVDAITNGTLDLLVSYGLEKQSTIDTWKRTYAHYVPLKRDMESDANYSGAFGLGAGTGSGFDVRGGASRRALGSKRRVTDILANVAMQRERAITRGEKNRVSQAVYGLALTAPNPEFWIPINTELNKRLSPAALAKVVAELVSIGVNPIDAQNLAREPVQRYIDPKTGLEMERINPALRGRDDVLSTRINGEDRYVMFSNKKRAQEMVRNLKNLDAPNLSGALQVIAPVTRWFAAVNTQYNPVFGLTNGLRDLSTGILNLSSTPLSGHRAEIARNAFSALKGVYLDLRDHRAGRAPTSQWAQLFEQFQADGGQTGYRDMFLTSADRAADIADELKQAGNGQRWLALGEKHSVIFGWLSDYNTSVENAMRLSAYKAALDNGMSRDAAASLAKNLTVNFNKKGLAAVQTGALYAFFNAAVQGTARIAETTSKDGKLTDAGQKIVYGGMMVGVLQAVLGMLAGWDDEEPPQFQREKNFIIPIPGSDKYVNIPMPLGFHVLPNIGRITAELLLSGGRDPGKRLLRLANVVLDAFNPIGSGTFAQTLSPTVGDPIIALAENEDWTGKPIYKEDFSKMQPTAGWTRTKDTASPPSRWLAYALNYITGGGKYEIGAASPTPDQIDYLVGQATGGVGRELLKTAQYTSSKVTGEELPIHKTPLGVGRFVGETKGQASETSRFYSNLRRIGEHKSALDEMREARDGNALIRYLEKHPDARLVQVADKAQREIGYLRRQKRELIEKGGSKERVRMIEDKITGLTRRYNEMLSEKR